MFAGEVSASGQEPDPQAEGETRPVVLGRAASSFDQEVQTVTLGEGTRVMNSPSRRAVELARLAIEREAQVIAKARGESGREWFEVRVDTVDARSLRGFVPATEGMREELSLEALPFTEVDPVRSEAEARKHRLERARLEMGRSAVLHELSGFLVLSDVPETHDVLERVRLLASQIPELYETRYSLRLPEPKAAQSSRDPDVVLFLRQESYDRYAQQEGVLGTLDSAGHAAPGLAVLVLGKRTLEDFTRTFVHELAHLLNQKVFPYELPAWLEEGMAEDLAGGTFRRRRFDPETIREKRVVRTYPTVDSRGRRARETELTVSGLRVNLARELASEGSLHAATLMELDWNSFMLLGDAQRNYLRSGFLVRYLVSSEHRPGFLRFLAELADVEPGFEDQKYQSGAEMERLAQHLETSLADLSSGLDQWAKGEAREAAPNARTLDVP